MLLIATRLLMPYKAWHLVCDINSRLVLIICLSLQKVEVPHLEEEASDSEDDNDDNIDDNNPHNNGEMFQCDMVYDIMCNVRMCCYVNGFTSVLEYTNISIKCLLKCKSNYSVEISLSKCNVVK